MKPSMACNVGRWLSKCPSSKIASRFYCQNGLPSIRLPFSQESTPRNIRAFPLNSFSSSSVAPFSSSSRTSLESRPYFDVMCASFKKYQKNSFPMFRFPQNCKYYSHFISNHNRDTDNWQRRLSIFPQPRYPLVLRPIFSRKYSNTSDDAYSENEYGFRQRIRYFFKKIRPWNTDDFAAMFGWLFVGHSLFILIGTTTFASLLLFLAHSLQFQEYIAYQLGKYLTKETGISVLFDSAIVPHWRQGSLRFYHVKAHRDFDHEDKEAHCLEERSLSKFDLSIDSMDIKISLLHFLEGKGLVRECVLRGVRGVIDRRHLDSHLWDELSNSSRKRPFQWGDFHLKSFHVEDLRVTVLYPSFRPFVVSVYTAQCSPLRKQWLLYDLLASKSVTGLLDQSLFSLYTPQGIRGQNDENLLSSLQTHLKIHGVNIDFINSNANGPFTYITQGSVDVEAIISRSMEHQWRHSMTDIFMSKALQLKSVLLQFFSKPPEDYNESEKSQNEPSIIQLKRTIEESVIRDNAVGFDFKVRMNHLKASVPLMVPQWSIMNSALIRPIVAYINAHHTSIPLVFKFSVPLSSFKGAWSPYDCEFMEFLEKESTKSFLNVVMDEKEKTRRLKKIGLWNLQNVSRQLVSIYNHLQIPRRDGIELEDYFLM